MAEPENPHWERAQEYLRQRQLPAATGELHVLQSINPGGAHTHLLTAQIAWQEGRIATAADQALAAAQVANDDPAFAIDLITTLRIVGEMACAQDVFTRTPWPQAEPAGMLYRRAILCQGFGEYVQALALFDKLAVGAPDTAMWHFFRGQQLEYLGRFEEADAAYGTCLATSPGFGFAAYKRVRLPLPHDGAAQLQSIEAGLQQVQPGTSGRADFGFARYHVLEGLGRADEAWQALDTANAEMRALGITDVNAEEAAMQHACARMAAQSFPATGTMPAGACPIFIVGMPRSGTTVLEQMLGNHSQVSAAGELTDFGAQLIRVLGHRDLFGEQSGAGIATLDHAELGRRYLAQTASRAAGRAYLVDKQPTNWMMVGLIHAALPRARILHMVRDPMDTCFSIWRARFADAHAWSYDLDAVATHFQTCRRMMAHWKQTCPDAILDVDYAQLVNHPATTLRRVMDFCGLAWEAGCEDLSRNGAPVRTLSAAQVRDGVNTRGMGRWRRYARQLEPLRQRLSQA